MIIMLLTIVMDLVSSGIALTDLATQEDLVYVSGCGFEWSDGKRRLATLTLFFVFSRGVLVLLFNVGLFIYVARMYTRLGKPKIVAPVVSESKTNQEDLWISYPGPREEDQTQPEDRPDVQHEHPDHDLHQHHQHTQEHREEEHHYQAPVARGHHDQDPVHRGYRDVYHNNNNNTNRYEEPNSNNNNRTARRAPSFADRLKEAETNFSNKVSIFTLNLLKSEFLTTEYSSDF